MNRVTLDQLDNVNTVLKFDGTLQDSERFLAVFCFFSHRNRATGFDDKYLAVYNPSVLGREVAASDKTRRGD